MMSYNMPSENNNPLKTNVMTFLTQHE